MEIKYSCPLGSDCETTANNQIQRCCWYVKLQGKDPQSERYRDEWGCAIAWLPVLLVENAQTNRGQTQAIESLRNEAVNKTRDIGKILLVLAKNLPQLGSR